MSLISEKIDNQYNKNKTDFSQERKTIKIKNKSVDNEISLNENKNMVNHPQHYSMNDSVYEPYKVIQAWNANFNIGSALKYLARYQKKFNPIEDLQKAKQYIDFEIEHLKEKDI